MWRFRLILGKYGTSAYGLAVLLSIPLWYFFLNELSPFQLKKMDEGVLGEHRHVFWEDFDGDGITEILHCAPWKKDFYSFPLYHPNGEVIVQYNIKGSLSRFVSQSVSFGDFDQNGDKEFYVVSNIGDSLLLNVIEPTGKGHILKNRLLGYTRKGKAGYDYEVFSSQMYDVNGDGRKEFVTMISGGFNLYPRKVYLYDVVNDQLKTSDCLGARGREVRIGDLNQDGLPEFAISNYGSGNMRAPLPKFNDYNAYLFILDENLKALRTPQVFEGETQFLQIFPVSVGTEHYWCVFNKCSSHLDELGFNFYLIDYQGKIVKQKRYEYLGRDFYISVLPVSFQQKEGALVFREDGHLFQLGKDLELIKEMEFREVLSPVCFFADLDADGSEEVVSFSRKGQNLYVFREAFQDYEMTKLNAVPGAFYAAQVSGKYHQPSFYLQIGNHWYDFIYHEVQFFYWKAAARFVGIYLGVLLLVLLIQRITAGHDRRKKRLAELQLTSWKNQLDPHFTFNTLNSVGSVILSEERFKAYDFFSRFSKLVRYALEASSKVSVSLEEELRFIELYLQLEKFRFKNKFEYEFQVDDAVNRKKQVPKMLLQTYVENAVRHGLMERKEKGFLLVKIYKAANHLVFHVEDNGIGRKAAARKKQLGNGIGMKVMQDYFDLLNSINDKSIKFKVLDSNAEDEKYPGTLVLILIPIGFSYKI